MELDEANEAATDITDAPKLDLTRAIRLGQLLRVRVLVDESGWLRGDVEVTYQRERGNTIRPITVNGMEAATARATADRWDFDVTVIRNNSQIFRFLTAVPKGSASLPPTSRPRPRPSPASASSSTRSRGPAGRSPMRSSRPRLT